jgi:NAD-dependent SIR2 family protein deacetylase
MNERGNLQVFSLRCMECHNSAGHTFCKMTDLPTATLVENCIDCHMPALPSGSITLLTNAKMSPVADSIRTHLITIYGEAAKQMTTRLKKKS